jgi:hypothetical protein
VASGIEEKCDLVLEDEVEVFPNHLFDVIRATNSIPSYVIVAINSNSYRGEVYLKDSVYQFRVDYPQQLRGQRMTVTAYDQHGCQSNQLQTAVAIWVWERPTIDPGLVLANKIQFQLQKGERFCVQIGSKIYATSFSKYAKKAISLSFPVQKKGTTLLCWMEDIEGRYSGRQTVKILDPQIKLTANRKPDAQRFSGSIFYSNSKAKSGDILLTNATLKVGKKTYKKSYKSPVKSFSFRYPVQKSGTKVFLTTKDINGYRFTRTFKIPNQPIKLKVQTVKYGSKRVAGTTAANAKVTVTIGKKKYRSKASAKGKFVVAIPVQKKGTTVSIKAVNSLANYNKKKVIVAGNRSKIKLKNLLFVNTKKVNMSVSNVLKGEKMEVVIHNTAYTFDIKHNSKIYEPTISIGSHQAGDNVQIILYDMFGEIRSQMKSKIYFSDTIKKGMKSKNVRLTTWGAPVKINKKGAVEQWVYDTNSGVAYVYIRDGVVIALQDLRKINIK